MGENPNGTWTLRIRDSRTDRYRAVLQHWTLTVYGHRKTPGSLRIASVTPGSGFLVVGWKAPSYVGASDVTAYNLRYKSTEDDTWTVIEGDDALSAGKRSHKIEGLANGTAYNIQVRAVNDEGDGLWSASRTVAAGNNSPFFGNSAAERSIVENTPAGVNIGDPITATDYDNDTLTYSVSGDDASSFNFDTATGQLQTKDALDFETKDFYHITVSVSDGKNVEGEASTEVDDTADVEVVIWNKWELPVLVGDRNPSYEENGTGPVATYTTINEEQRRLTWSLTGADADKLNIDAMKLEDESYIAQMSFIDGYSPDYENPTDSNRDRKYQVTIKVYDGAFNTLRGVTVTVDDVDEPFVSGSRNIDRSENATPGLVDTYTLNDPEGNPVTTNVTWTRSGLDASKFRINNAGQLRIVISPDYENPTDSDEDRIYQVTVRATDGTNTATLDVTVTVTNVNEPPRISGDANPSYDEGSDHAIDQYLATDPDANTTITWTLSGPDANKFTIRNGELKFRTSPDYENPTDSGGDRIYQVTVEASDGTNTATLDVTVTVTNVSETSRISGDANPSYEENRTDAVASYTAPDLDTTTTIRWSLSGPDTDKFTIRNGELKFRTSPDYENPTDSGGGNDYQVTVRATDGTDTAILDVTVTVTDVDEIVIIEPVITRPVISGPATSGPVDDSGEEAPPRASGLFEDVAAGVWYEPAVSWMILHKVTSGCTTKLFCPDDDLTRQQFVTFLWRAAGRPTPTYTGSQAFSDVNEGVYSDQAIGWAVSKGITLGCTTGQLGDPDWKFCPRAQVTRGQMASFLYRHAETDHTANTSPYTDIEPDRYYTDSVAWLTDFQVVPGCTTDQFCPSRAATRAEAALFIHGVATRPHTWGTDTTPFPQTTSTTSTP